MELQFKDFYLREVAIANEFGVYAPEENRRNREIVARFISNYTTFDDYIDEKVKKIVEIYNKLQRHIKYFIGSSEPAGEIDDWRNIAYGKETGESEEAQQYSQEEFDDEAAELRTYLRDVFLPDIVLSSHLDVIDAAEDRMVNFLKNI